MLVSMILSDEKATKSADTIRKNLSWIPTNVQGKATVIENYGIEHKSM